MPDSDYNKPDYFISWEDCLPNKIDEVIPYFQQEPDLYKGNQYSDYFILTAGTSTITYPSDVTSGATYYYTSGSGTYTSTTSYTFTTGYWKVNLPPAAVKGCSFEGEVEGCIEFEET